jgi:hypothetical protein
MALSELRGDDNALKECDDLKPPEQAEIKIRK